jgi:hypothetical protein
MTPDEPVIPAGYGDYELSLTQGAGGLTGAVTDVARLAAILISQNDSPALQRATIVNDMLLPAVACAAAHPGGRAGYGLDGASDPGGGSFYGQKGGLIINAASVLQFNGDWGFVAVFGSPAQQIGVQPPWYPDWPDVMTIAEAVDWGDTDLFPDFGMPSL